MSNDHGFNKACPGGNISARIMPNPPPIDEDPVDLRCPYCKTVTDDGEICNECLLALAELREDR